ncbi:hypothetical protein BO70DRAFT_308885 [Aspergillus heteromorphus CBS 117.55]|uniref:Terpenoid synthase n=1 Tax=Aspergillus heteromorphus CBS 117.55 TaxID=1448321 RepID=A0A317WUE6_9EURO|nr:uncharacterized protein BO70DRAFT_308885 [Aspergillus heteromorphus CBS 117.55]PWY88922.1 hypothetical protein BO70DRAFT_308885 [Aspergillus heteromorphus CBS 117.55]
MEFATTWIHSVAVEDFDVRRFGAFTTLPVRISKYNDVASSAARKLTCDWEASWVRHSGSPMLPTRSWGDLLALTIPEVLPERVSTAVRLAELSRLCDAFCNQLDSHCRREGYEMLNKCFDLCSSSSFSCSCSSGGCGKSSGGKHAQIKALVSEVILELIQTDREHGMHILNLYRQAVMSESSFGCRTSSPFRTFWPILEFAIALKLSDCDRSILHNIKCVVDECLILNDEYWNGRDKIGGLGQTDFCGRMNGLSVDAGEDLRRRIIALESRYLALRAEFYWKYPAESIRLRRWIEAAGAAMASYNYWRASTSSSRPCSTESWTCVTRSSSSCSSQPPAYPSCYKKDECSILTAPTSYVSSFSPSQALSMVPSAINTWVRAPAGAVGCVSSIITALYNGTTILDDINTKATQRYSQPAAHTVFGAPQAANSAHYTFIQAISDAQKMSNPAVATEILLGGLRRFYTGQSRELSWSHTACIPSEPEYLSAIDDTTGSIYTITANLLQAESCTPRHCQPDLIPLATLLARFARVKEEYITLRNREIRECASPSASANFTLSLSYPIVRLVASRPETRAQVSKMIFEKKELQSGKPDNCACDNDRKGDCCGYNVNVNSSCLMLLLTQSGALGATREFLRELEDKIEKEIMQIEKCSGECNPVMRMVLSRLREGLMC